MAAELEPVDLKDWQCAGHWVQPGARKDATAFKFDDPGGRRRQDSNRSAPGPAQAHHSIYR